LFGEFVVQFIESPSSTPIEAADVTVTNGRVDSIRYDETPEFAYLTVHPFLPGPVTVQLVADLSNDPGLTLVVEWEETGVTGCVCVCVCVCVSTRSLIAIQRIFCRSHRFGAPS
jgi:hypothetical protein